MLGNKYRTHRVSSQGLLQLDIHYSSRRPTRKPLHNAPESCYYNGKGRLLFLLILLVPLQEGRGPTQGLELHNDRSMTKITVESI